MKRCIECGTGRIHRLAKEGRTSPYRNMQSVPIPADFKIPTCDTCGAEWLDEDTAEALDGVLETEYKRMLLREMRESLGEDAD